MPETNTVPIQCPNCGNQYQAPIRSIIDVGQQPQLRQAFLAGQINLAVCPKCRAGGMIDVPLVYHDPAAEFLAVYFPQQLNISEMEKQRAIGELTQGLMRSLPPEQRKGYFLSPRQFATRQSLMDAVLGTMGISQEELDRQRKKMKMVEQFMVMADDIKGLQMLAKGQDAQLDFEFFSILDNMQAQAEAAGDAKNAERLKLLRDNLMPLTSFGKIALKQQAAVESLKDVNTPEEFLDRVIATDADEATAIAIAARPALDYNFFESLTARIEASQGAERDRLTKLRDELLDVTQRIDQSARAGVEDAVKLLGEIINSPNPRTAARERIDEIDDVFMSVLAANMQRAEKENNEALMERFEMVYDEVMSMIEAGLPPEVQLINEILRAPYPDGTRELLLEHRAEMTPKMLDLMSAMAEDMAQRSDESAEFANTAKRLKDIRTQAMLMV
jgi:CpXC protein